MKFTHRKITVLICGFMAVVLTVWWIQGWQKNSLLKNRWPNIHIGMSKEEVRMLLGSPDDIYPVNYSQSNSFVGSIFVNWMFDSLYEKWAYGDRHTINFQSQFPYVNLAWDGFMAPEANDYVIYFSWDGKVVKKKHPYRAKESSG